MLHNPFSKLLCCGRSALGQLQPAGLPPPRPFSQMARPKANKVETDRPTDRDISKSSLVSDIIT